MSQLSPPFSIEHPNVTIDIVSHTCEQLASGDTRSLGPLVDRLLAEGVPAMTIALRLIDPVLVEIGEKWACNRITVAQEHVSTAACERALGQLASELSPKRDRGDVAVVGCPAGERHAVGARIAADWLRSEGWRVVYLGADVPNNDFVTTVLDHHAVIAAVTVTCQLSIPSAKELVQNIRSVSADVQILVGGGAAIPADFPEANFVAGRDLLSAGRIVASGPYYGTPPLR